jgi:hypothetical protein
MSIHFALTNDKKLDKKRKAMIQTLWFNKVSLHKDALFQNGKNYSNVERKKDG